MEMCGRGGEVEMCGGSIWRNYCMIEVMNTK